jgi:hypothetical protein
MTCPTPTPAVGPTAGASVIVDTPAFRGLGSMACASRRASWEAGGSAFSGTPPTGTWTVPRVVPAAEPAAGRGVGGGWRQAQAGIHHSC